VLKVSPGQSDYKLYFAVMGNRFAYSATSAKLSCYIKYGLRYTLRYAQFVVFFAKNTFKPTVRWFKDTRGQLLKFAWFYEKGAH